MIYLSNSEKKCRVLREFLEHGCSKNVNVVCLLGR